MLLSHLMFLSFLVLLLVGHFLSVLFDRIFATNPSPSPKHNVRIGKIIHCYPLRMRNPPSVVWLDRIRNMALVVQITRHFQIMKLGTLISQNCTEDRAWRYVCSFRNQFYYYRFIITMVIRLMTTLNYFQRVNNSVCLRRIFIILQYKQKEPDFESTQRPIH